MSLAPLAATVLVVLNPFVRLPASEPPIPRTPRVEDTQDAASQCPLKTARALLATGESADRERAAKLLLGLGTNVAVREFLAALRSHDPRLADSAQEAFSLLPGPESVEALLSRDGLRSRNRALQLRCAEILGRIDAPVNAQSLLKHVKVRDVELSRMLLWSVERLASRDLLAGKHRRTIKSIRLLTGRGDNDPMRAAAMQALSLLAPRDSAISMDNLDEGTGPETAAALMDTLVRLKPGTLMAKLRAGVVHSNPLVRMRAIDMLRKIGINRNELDLLVARLSEEPRTAIRSRIHRLLRYMTGHPAPPDVDEWTRFAENLAPDWNAGHTTTLIPEATRVLGGLHRLRELEPSSDRIAILVDVSADFWRDAANGESTAAMVLPEVVQLLGCIEQTASFLLVPFSDTPLPYSPTPVMAKPENILAAQAYLRDTLPGAVPHDRPSNISAALDHALSFPEIDRVIVLTAARRHVGAHVDVPLLARLYREKTRFRPAIFDFVVVNASGTAAAAWSKLTTSRAGRFFDLRVW